MFSKASSIRDSGRRSETRGRSRRQRTRPEQSVLWPFARTRRCGQMQPRRQRVRTIPRADSDKRPPGNRNVKPLASVTGRVGLSGCSLSLQSGRFRGRAGTRACLVTGRMWIISVVVLRSPTAAAVRTGRRPEACPSVSGKETAIGKTGFHP